MPKSTRAKVRQAILHVIDAAWKKGSTPIVPPNTPDVAKFIYLKDSALATFGDEMELQGSYGNVVVEHAAYVTEDGSLILTGTGPRAPLRFLLRKGGWDWCKPLA